MNVPTERKSVVILILLKLKDGILRKKTLREEDH
jgi:hypothetical protein